MALIDCFTKFPTSPSAKLAIVEAARAEIASAAKEYAKRMPQAEAEAQAVQDKIDELVSEYDRVQAEVKAAYDKSPMGQRKEKKRAVEAKPVEKPEKAAVKEEPAEIEEETKASIWEQTPEAAKREDLDPDALYRKKAGPDALEPGTLETLKHTVDEIEGWFKPVLAKMRNAPEVVVVAEAQEIPGQKPDRTVKGVFKDGKIYIVAAGVESKFDAHVTFYHELVGHYGLRAVLGAAYDSTLTQIALKSPKVRAAAQQWREQNADLIAERKKAGMSDKDVRLLSIEEAIADMAHQGKFKQIFRQLVAAIANALRAAGLNSLADRIDRANDSDVMRLLAASRNWLEAGEGSATKNSKMPLFNQKTAAPVFFSQLRRTGRSDQWWDAASQAERDELIEKARGPSKQPGFYLTPEMKAKAQEGFPLFRRGPAKSAVMEQAQTIGDSVGMNMLGKARRGLLKLQFLRDIREQFKSLPGLSAHVDRIFEMASSANDYIKAAGKVAKRWDALTTEQAQAVDEIASTATVMGIHPDIPLDLVQHLQASGREISNAHLADKDGNFDPDVVAAHKALNDKWRALAEPAKGVYKSARDSMGKNWDRREKLLNRMVHAYFAPEIKKAETAGNKALVRSLTKERDGYIREYGRLLARVQGPYFPLLRFGDFYVVYKSEKYQAAEKKLHDATTHLQELYTKYKVPLETIGEVDVVNLMLEDADLPTIATMAPEARVELREARKAARGARKEMQSMQDKEEHYSNEAFESEAAARRRAEELGVSVRLKEEHLREISGTNYAMINKLGQAVESALPDAKIAAEAREAMMQVWLQSLPDQSALRRELKRKRVAGFSNDMMRAFSTYSQRDAHYLSRLEHMEDIIDSLAKLRRETRGKGLEREEVYNEMARRYAASVKFTDTPIQDAITATAFIYQLGISPAFLATNLSQPWLISMPLMAARHGIWKSNAHLAKAFKQVGEAAKASMKDQKTWFFEINTGNFRDGEQRMFSKALRQGLLDITLEYDLGAYASGGESKFSKTTRIMSVLPHQVEVVNRMMTALAAYRMELDRTKDQAKAEEYAMDVLAKTHFDYSAANAPYVMKPGVVPFGKVLFQYRKYQLGILTLLARQIGSALKGATAQEREEARAALLGLVTLHGAVAGTLGLPFVGAATFAANIIAKMFGDDDEPFDAERALRNWFADVLGVELGAAAAKGLPMLLGADLENKLGMGAMLSPIRIMRDDKQGRDLYLEILAASMGPSVGGLAPRFFEGVAAMSRGDILKGSEAFVPKFASDAIKAARVGTEGVTSKAGNTTLDADRVSPWDVVLQGLGIPTSIITETNEATGAVEDAKRFFKARRGELEKAYVKARQDKDTEKLAEVQADIREYNAKRREKGEPTIKPVDLLNAFKQREGYVKNRVAPGISLPRAQRGLANYARFADTEQ